MNTMSNLALYQFTSLGTENSVERKASTIPGYLAVSTAPYNVEEERDIEYDRLQQEASKLNSKDAAKLLSHIKLLPFKKSENVDSGQLNSLEGIDNIAREIANSLCTRADEKTGIAELVIGIHGYNMDALSVKKWHQKNWNYANTQISTSNAVYLGYRWPSERVQFLNNSILALQSLPYVPGMILLAGILGFFAILLLRSIPIALISSPFIFLANLVIALAILKIVVYFRDSYRATHFATPDLVELIKNLDRAISKNPNKPHRIKLNFIAHSMGGFVTTSTVRILSDVFSDSPDSPEKLRQIGKHFTLGRLVLVSPDIPFGAILSGRANFLKSSLRRFEEAYLFSNEGDLALRIASTAANYFSFPTQRRDRGHRLGNVTVRSLEKSKEPIYGVVNYSSKNRCLDTQTLTNYLEVNTLGHSICLNTIQTRKLKKASSASTSNENIGSRFSDLFTYFDCTNYIDFEYGDIAKEPKQINLLCYRLDRCYFLNVFVYIKLLFAWSLGLIDVHGGYFNGQLGLELIHKLAFIGFANLLPTLQTSNQDLQKRYEQVDKKIFSLNNMTEQGVHTSCQHREELSNLIIEKQRILFEIFSYECKSKQIQVAFSPERFQVDIEGKDLSTVRKGILGKDL